MANITLKRNQQRIGLEYIGERWGIRIGLCTVRLIHHFPELLKFKYRSSVVLKLRVLEPYERVKEGEVRVSATKTKHKIKVGDCFEWLNEDTTRVYARLGGGYYKFAASLHEKGK